MYCTKIIKKSTQVIPKQNNIIYDDLKSGL